MIGFVGNLLVPKSIDSGLEGDLLPTVLINTILIAIFGVSHTIMARPSFKEKINKIFGSAIERSNYVLVTSLALMLIFSQWRPLNDTIWDLSGSVLGTVLFALFWVGWVIVLLSTFMINHFDLFGLRQVYLNLKKKEYRHSSFTISYFYKFVRHPIMTGFIIAFWCTPIMTKGHLLFAVLMTIYMIVAVKYYEEKDLVDFHGDAYKEYQKQVPMLLPVPGKMASKK